jgi:hypothetical protein
MTVATDIGPYVANKKNALALIEWLEQGAPHVLFDIEYAASRLDHMSEIEAIHVIDEAEQRGDLHVEMGTGGRCGTVCCIAGAASQLHLGEFGEFMTKTEELSWDEVQENAVEYLGLVIEPYEYDYGGSMWGIFDPDSWPETPSGKQAAHALLSYSHSGDYRAAIVEAINL